MGPFWKGKCSRIRNSVRYQTPSVDHLRNLVGPQSPSFDQLKLLAYSRYFSEGPKDRRVFENMSTKGANSLSNNTSNSGLNSGQLVIEDGLEDWLLEEGEDGKVPCESDEEIPSEPDEDVPRDFDSREEERVIKNNRGVSTDEGLLLALREIEADKISEIDLSMVLTTP
ncbi:hypothetical protein QYF36_024850 [Acer negundo]|nr:hypothetical protein QYF36_024850 [Acer negundo]